MLKFLICYHLSAPVIVIIDVTLLYCRPAPVKVGCCRALSELFPRVDTAVLRPHLGTVFSALGKLVQEVRYIGSNSMEVHLTRN